MPPTATPFTPQQKKVVIAAFLGWMLDAFDFFLLVFLLQRHRRRNSASKCPTSPTRCS